jgi:hypothetical protein
MVSSCLAFTFQLLFSKLIYFCSIEQYEDTEIKYYLVYYLQALSYITTFVTAELYIIKKNISSE